jgi:hypothetical protein
VVRIRPVSDVTNHGHVRDLAVQITWHIACLTGDVGSGPAMHARTRRYGKIPGPLRDLN